MGDPVYTTREVVKTALENRGGAGSDAQIDRLIAAKSREIERTLHRRFWPWYGTRRFDWPAQSGANRFSPSWLLELGSPELIELEQLTADGEEITLANVNLEPADRGVPYSRIELNRGTDATFTAGNTNQRTIAALGLWGWDLDETPIATLSGTVDDTNPVLEVSDASAIGTGSLLRIGTERVQVTRLGLTAAGRTLTAVLTDRANDQVLYLDSATNAPNPGETVGMASERMLVTDRVGTAVFVKRAVDGTTIADHAIGAAVYVKRTLTVERGAAGTPAAGHTAGDDVHVWDPFPPIETLCVAEVIAAVMQENAAMSRTVGAGEAEREASSKGLADARKAAAQYKRRNRNRAV